MFEIVWNVIAPIFVMMAVGFGVQRGLGLDGQTLTRLNFWIFVPCVLWVQITQSNLSPHDMGVIFAHFVLLMATMSALAWQLAKLCGADGRMRRALTASTMFYNSGNYGIPAAQLAFAPHAAFATAVQAIVIMLQNISNFTIGIALQAGGREGHGWRQTLGAVFRLPMIYVLMGAWLWRWIGWKLPVPLDQSVRFIADGMVPVALVTLGAQMARLESHRVDKFIVLSLMLRLVAGPLLSWGVVRLMNVQGELAQALIVSASFPTAVNFALLASEFDNEPDFAAAAVFYSTLASAVTVSLTIYFAKMVV